MVWCSNQRFTYTVLTIDADIGEELRTSLVEEYANQKKPTDGEIYRKIRQYEGDGNEAFRQRWFVRLSRSNQERLDQLDNRKNRCLRLAFDRLLPIPGLWPHGMRISMLHRLIATGCVEVSSVTSASFPRCRPNPYRPVGDPDLSWPYQGLLVLTRGLRSRFDEED